ncbi:hypothetical protein FPT12_07935 [Pseudomonas sp. H3(2019)]|nr:hypothetical protein FPT12_07935 [Pseudomonas sp. H3(2019)]
MCLKLWETAVSFVSDSPGRFIDSDHPPVAEFAERHRGDSRDPLEQSPVLLGNRETDLSRV